MEEKEGLLQSTSFNQSYEQKSESSSRASDTVSEKKRKVPFFSLFRYASKTDKALMIIGSVFSIIHGAGWPVLAIIFGQMTNTFLRAQNSYFGPNAEVAVQNVSNSSSIPPITAEEFLDSVIQFALYYALVGFAMFVASYAQVVCWALACSNQIHRLRKAFFKAVLRQEISWYDKNQGGEMTARLNDDIERIREGIGDKFSMFLQYAASFVAGFAIGFVFSWKLTLVMMSLTPLLALSGAFVAKLISSSTKREQEKYAKAGAVAEEVISCVRTVLSFNGQSREVQRYKNALEEGKAIGLRKYAFMGAGIFFTFVVMYSTYALAFWYGSVLILDDPTFPRGTIFTVFFAVMLGSSSLGSAAPHLSSLAISQGAAEKIFDIIDTEPKIDPYSYSGQRPQHVKGKIELHKVRFSYPTRKHVKVLNGVNLRVEPAQKVALVGASGCGKSTIVNLLLRYYDVLGGKITVDGYEISQLNVHFLRNLIGVVSQEPVLFDGTIEENIKLGSQDVTKEAVVAAAKMANAFNFIEQLPEKFETRTGERGVQLSGGQKQRIAIARALVRNPKILILDEATSALDAESEKVVQDALNNAQQGRTTIAIAHRLATIKDYDWIYVFESGFIVEQGKHLELMEKKGVYYKMVLAQQLDDPESDVEVGEASDAKPSASESEANHGSKAGSEVFSRKQSRARTLSRQLSSRTKTFTSQSSVAAPLGDVAEFDRIQRELKEENAERVKWTKIIRENKNQWMWLISGFLGATISGTIMPLFALFYSQIFGVYSKEGDELREGSIFWSMMFLVLGFAQGTGFYLSCYSFGQTGENLTMGLRLKVFANLLRQDVAYFDDELHSTGKICTRLATDAPNVKAAVGFRISSIFTATMAMVAAIVIAFVFGWKLALVIMTMLPLMILSGFLSFKLHVSNQARDIKLLEAAGKISSDAIGNIRTVQALCRELHFYSEYCHQLEKPYKESLKQDQIKGLGFAFSQSVIFFMYAAAFRYGGSLVVAGEMEPLNVYRVFFAIAFCGLSFGESSSFIPDYVKARMSASLLFFMINLQPNIDSCSPNGLKPDIKGNLSFKHVYFSYPTRPNTPVLRGLNFSVKTGKTLALVGSSGCGKSTVVSLVQRYYDAASGQILVDGYDLRSLNLPNYRKHLAVVSQEPVLFDCSIRENISYGVENSVTHEQIVQAAKLANIHDFILNLPQGYNTFVGDKGTQLSGGQKQRIAIARALVREPTILLLDEATSALDTESEKLVQEALDRAREGRTCIMIAHRLSTVQNADCIAVVRDGKIVEKGNHSELLNQKGLYFKMSQMQSLIDN